MTRLEALNAIARIVEQKPATNVARRARADDDQWVEIRGKNGRQVLRVLCTVADVDDYLR